MFLKCAIQKLEEMSDWDLRYLQHNEPDIIEVFVRRSLMRGRVTASGATDTSSGTSSSSSS